MQRAASPPANPDPHAEREGDAFGEGQPRRHRRSAVHCGGADLGVFRPIDEKILPPDEK
jgi:hypothetical protein